MPRLFARLVTVLAVIYLVAQFWPWKSVRHAPGILVKQEPIQTDIPPKALPSVDDWKIEAVAAYDITSRILHTKRYFSGPGSDVVPIDVAVGWGKMSDQAVLDQLSISQSNRFYFYHWWGNPPIPQQEMVCHSANMHLISADSSVASAIRGLYSGEVVKMRGYLVNATMPNGGVWKTSLSRADSGNGACELFYVQQVAECPTTF